MNGFQKNVLVKVTLRYKDTRIVLYTMSCIDKSAILFWRYDIVFDRPIKLDGH